MICDGAISYFFWTDSNVEDKTCIGTECKEIKSITSDKEGDQVDGKSTVLNTTPGTD